MSDLAKQPVLRLQILRQFRPLAERRVFEVYLSDNPLLPGLPWVNYRVCKYSLGFSQEIRYIIRIYLHEQVLYKDTIVDIPVVIDNPHLLVV